ncbi:MAG: hypothetical protein F4Z75_10065, partial [Synechococcus sp. SB0668_bin_15]|nr:hypothetical protein [Synechococcus sp. SB0668_bin_15]
MRRLSAPRRRWLRLLPTLRCLPLAMGLATRQPRRSPPFPSSATGGPGGALFLAPLLALACFGAVPKAAAQTTGTFVSNVGQPVHDLGASRSLEDVSIQFRTGNQQDVPGYRLSSIEVPFTITRGPFRWTASIYTDPSNNGQPGTLVGTLKTPTITQSSSNQVDQVLEFMATETDDIFLEKNTQYVFVIDVDSRITLGTTEATNWLATSLRRTESGNEDPGAASGWNIGKSYIRSFNSGGGFSLASSSTHLMMRLKGFTITLGDPEPRLINEGQLSTMDVKVVGAPGRVWICLGGTANANYANDFDFEYRDNSGWNDGGIVSSATGCSGGPGIHLPVDPSVTGFRITAKTDTKQEMDETVEVKMGGVTRTITITSKALVFSPTSLTVNEGAGADYTVRLSHAPSGMVTVTVGGTSGTDLTVDTDLNTNGSQNQLTFTTSDWNNPKTVRVTAGQDDDTTDDSATLIHTASGGGYGSLTGNVSVRVKDDDTTPPPPALPVVTIVPKTNSNAVTEGTPAVFRVTRTGATTNALTVRLNVEDAANSDFVATDNEGEKTVMIAVGSSTADYSVSTSVDTTDEPDGPVKVTVLADATKYTVGSASSATRTVQDDDTTTVTLTGDTNDVNEGATKDFTLTIGRALRDGETLAVPLSFAGTATRGTSGDYMLACPNPLPTGVTCSNLNSGTAMVTFTGSSGGSATSVLLTLSATIDSVTEVSGETVNIGLGIPTATGLGGGASKTDFAGVFRINDQPSTPTVSFSSSAYRVLEGDEVRVTVNISPMRGSSTVVLITYSSGTAGSDDYSSSPANVTIPANTSLQSFTIATTEDTTAEPSETFSIAIGTLPAGVSKGSPSTATVTINDDDGGGGNGGGGVTPPPLPTVSISGGNPVSEGEAAVFTLSRSGAVTSALTVLLAVSENEAEGQD